MKNFSCFWPCKETKLLSLQPISGTKFFCFPRFFAQCGVEQRQLVGLITRRSEVRILPPLPTIRMAEAILFSFLLSLLKRVSTTRYLIYPTLSVGSSEQSPSITSVRVAVQSDSVHPSSVSPTRHSEVSMGVIPTLCGVIRAVSLHHISTSRYTIRLCTPQ